MFSELFNIMGQKECFITFRPPDEVQDKGINFSELVGCIGTSILGCFAMQLNDHAFEGIREIENMKIKNTIQNMILNRICVIDPS